MKALCAAAALLAGWYLLAPPMYESYTAKRQLISVRAYPELPLTAWDKFGAYPTRARCEAQRHYNFDEAVRAGPGADDRQQALFESSSQALCVRADDPRLKPPVGDARR